MFHRKHQAGPLFCFYHLTAYILQILHHKVSATLFDLSARVARAHCNNNGTSRNPGFYPTGRIFEDDAPRGLIAKALSSEEERVWRGLAGTKSRVVRRDRHFGRDNTHSGKATMRCSCIPTVSPVATGASEE